MSKGQRPREPRYFPDMKYRAAPRHEQAAFGVDRSRRLPLWPCGRGPTPRVHHNRPWPTLSADECLLNRDLRCTRTDRKHTATARHVINRDLYNPATMRAALEALTRAVGTTKGEAP